jgi:hydrogenase assembly chaperone HypC/HupF
VAGPEGGLIEMCIAFPGVVVEVDAFGAVVDTEGRRRRASTLFLPDIAVGDWVAVAAGTIVERLEPDQAAEIQAILRAAIALEEDEATGGDEAVGHDEAVGGGAAAPFPPVEFPDQGMAPDAATTRSTREGAPDVRTI